MESIENVMDERDELKRAVRLWRNAAEETETQLRTGQEELAAVRAEVARLREVVSMCLKVLRAIPVHEGYSAVDKAIICSEVREAALSPDSGEWVAVRRELAHQIIMEDATYGKISEDSLTRLKAAIGAKP